jgi:hypothetical protein
LFAVARLFTGTVTGTSNKIKGRISEIQNQFTDHNPGYQVNRSKTNGKCTLQDFEIPNSQLGTKILENCIFEITEGIKMISKAFENELLKNLQRLNKEQQGRVLSFVRSLVKPKGTNHELLALAGTIDPKGIREMSEAIESGCEKIDANEW